MVRKAVLARECMVALAQLASQQDGVREAMLSGKRRGGNVLVFGIHRKLSSGYCDQYTCSTFRRRRSRDWYVAWSYLYPECSHDDERYEQCRITGRRHCAAAASSQEAAESHRDPRNEAGGRLLLAARQAESRSESLHRGRE